MIDPSFTFDVWRRAYGSVDACAGWFIATRFVEFARLPLFPRGSQLVMLGGEPGDAVEVTLGFESVALGYARVWCPAAALVLLLAVTRGGLADEGGWQMALGVAGLVVAVVASAAAWTLGRLTTDQKAQRLAYARHAKYPVDIARLAGVHDLVLSRIEPFVTERAGELVTARHYRQASSPDAAWYEVATDPLVTDVAFLSAAFTRARIDWHLSKGPARRRLAGIHRAIWANLRVVDPSLLEDAAKA